MDDAYNATGECRAIFNELSAYTLGHRGVEFIHQHVVDAYAAQHVAPGGKTIRTVFALAGLYLACEVGMNGRQVQRTHVRMARQRTPWPRLEPPDMTGTLTVGDVLTVQEGPARDR